MKKVEAQQLAIEKSKLIIEYIVQILSDPEKVTATMEFLSYKIENKKMLILDINVPKRNFSRCLNLGITSDHDIVLFEQLFNDLLDTFLTHETMGVTKYYSIKSMNQNFTGINAVNTIGSKILINFNSSGPEFKNLVDHYQAKYKAFEESINNNCLNLNSGLKK